MDDKKNKLKSLIIKTIILIIVILLFIILNKHFNISDKIKNILINSLEWIKSFGILTPIIFGLIYIICTVLLISGAVLTLGAGIIFGVIKGSIIVSIFSTLAAIASFLIGRFLLRNWVSKKIEQYPKFKAVDAAVAKEGWKIVGLTRLSPIFPFVFLNYAFGLTKISLKDYAIASWIGMMPGTIMYVYIGSLIGDIATLGAEGREKTPAEWIFTIIGLIITVIVTLYVTYISKKALSKKLDG
jgi:uncharacterized membrane protein YdjX (TVP38/TMEM64 family)